MRIEVFYKTPGMDGRSLRLLKSLKSQVASRLIQIEACDVFILAGPSDQVSPGFLPVRTAERIFSDAVVQNVAVDGAGSELKPLSDWDLLIEISYRPGVTNPMALTAREAVENALGTHLGPDVQVQTATQYAFKISAPLTEGELEKLKASLHNPLIQQAIFIDKAAWARGERFPEVYPHVSDRDAPEVQSIAMTGLSDLELEKLSRERLLALSLAEMKAIQSYFSAEETTRKRTESGLPSEPTDVELEMIAQTWSEHCKHKIFQANIQYHDTVTGETTSIRSLYNTYIKQTTRDLTPAKPFLRSVFHDNSGVVAFDEETLVCFKVETHNSPSALDPFGGAITGIVGVNRDILGTGKGAKPIFNTNFLCFGDPQTKAEDIPKGLLHPKQVLKGVHQGIVEGGNHSGIPTVAGGFLFDESYVGKPLVFCGTGGILPREIGGEDAYKKHVDPGDLAVMLGGRIGKDGIHGATFSSLALDEESPTSAVQIGDPITQRKMMDFLLIARDRGLYKGITDNGAGGLSSSLGEMADESGGVRIDLDRCPLKYQGLAPWEILVSESQERMSLAVSNQTITPFLELATRMGVEASVVGAFTASGAVEIFHHGRPVGALSLEFLHKGLPPMELKAEWIPPVRHERGLPADLDPAAALLRLLADPTIASKENLVRQYDHEVQGRSVIKPFTGLKMDGPTEGAVLKVRPDSLRGLTVTHGVCPRYSDIDAYQMALNAVDEAYRAHIALGGEPDEASVLDNFCWPDPVESEKTPDGRYKLAQLVRTCQGLREACLAYGLPLISGKDSMKNDAVMNGKKVSIRPTLLISLMGVIKDVSKSMSTDFLRPGDLVYLLGETRRELGGSSLEKVMGHLYPQAPTVRPDKALKLYRALHRILCEGWISSVHDLSDGGLAVALAESCIGGKLGASVDLEGAAHAAACTVNELLFSETPSRFLVSLPETRRADFEAMIGPQPHFLLGKVSEDPRLRLFLGPRELFACGLPDLESAWKSLNQER